LATFVYVIGFLSGIPAMVIFFYFMIMAFDTGPDAMSKPLAFFLAFAVLLVPLAITRFSRFLEKRKEGRA
jgi:hypothetical protein